MTLTEEIKRKALDLGFAKVGIAPAAEHPDEYARFQSWLARGYHASMQWMTKRPERRADIQNVLPGARSVICLADNYYSSDRYSAECEAGKISRYAWGSDYHTHSLRRIEMLADYIKALEPAVEVRSYVDTGPIMEKMWAEMTGVGWRGKHSNVITREFGSWVFLGEIITSLNLDSDSPATDLCGTCTACLDACPTGAIVEAYIVDSRRCIAYLTIEHRGEFASSIDMKLDRWIFGCDVCQEVCPWNRFEQETPHPEFRPREGNVTPRLEDIAGMSQEEFDRRFHDSPVERTKLAGLMRNAQRVLAEERGTME
jgi:epoxyqueuosine reductase